MNRPFKNLKVVVVRSDVGSQDNTVKPKSDSFHKLSVKIANHLGNAKAFFIAMLVIVVFSLFLH